jgi:hypothetical protein
MAASLVVVLVVAILTLLVVLALLSVLAVLAVLTVLTVLTIATTISVEGCVDVNSSGVQSIQIFLVARVGDGLNRLLEVGPGISGTG